MEQPQGLLMEGHGGLEVSARLLAPPQTVQDVGHGSPAPHLARDRQTFPIEAVGRGIVSAPYREPAELMERSSRPRQVSAVSIDL